MLKYVEYVYVLLYAKKRALNESQGDHYEIACLADRVVRCEEISEKQEKKVLDYAIREQLVSH